MDPSAFSQVKSSISRCNFKDEKLNALRSSSSLAQGYFSAEQVAELLREFPFDDDKLTALEICSQQMYSSTCFGVLPIVSAFSFNDKKVRAVEVLLGRITDRVPSAFDSVLHFQSDRSRVKEILERSPPAGSYPGPCPPHQGHGHHHHHHHHHHPPHPGYPGMHHPPGPSYPGMAPPPGPGYPTGMAPPPGPAYPTGMAPPGPPAPFPPAGPAPMPYPPGVPRFPLPGVFPPAPGHHRPPF